MAEHRWSGWPGAWCLDCGAEDAGEACLAEECFGVISCVRGHTQCTDHPQAECRHKNTPCPTPGAGNFDPYKHNIAVK
jgi:hypothetical protein